MPSISGASRWVRPTASPVSSSMLSTIRSTSVPTSASRAAWLIGSCTSEHSRSHSSTVSPSTAPSSPTAGVPSSGENAKKPAQSSCTAARKASSSSCCELGLAGKPDDERGAERRARLLRPDGIDHRDESLAAPPPPHASKERRGDVLQRQVEVRHDSGKLEHGGDERIAHLTRIEIEEADPLQPQRGKPVEATEQRRERTGLAHVAAVPGEILRDQHELGRSPGDQRARLGLDRLGYARPLLAAKRRDGAERAGAVAALGDLDVRPRCAGHRTRQLEQVAHAGGRARRRARTGGSEERPLPTRPRHRTRRRRRPRAVLERARRHNARPCIR